MTRTNLDALVAVLAELDQLRVLALGVAEREAPQLWPAPPPDAAAERMLWEVLLAARRGVFANPSAARGLFDLLATEGRRYAAATVEGRELRDALAASDAVEQLRRIWETVTLNVLDGPAAVGALPDAWVELVTDAIAASPPDENPRAADQRAPQTAPIPLEAAMARLRPDGFA